MLSDRWRLKGSDRRGPGRRSGTHFRKRRSTGGVPPVFQTWPGPYRNRAFSEWRVTRPSELQLPTSPFPRELLNAYERGLGGHYGVTRERS
jgi:hypothetical protein